MRTPVVSGISLANKCQLLFGAAVVAILIGALAVPWMRTSTLVHQSQVEVARQLADAWLDDRIKLGTLEYPGNVPPALPRDVDDPDDLVEMRMSLVRVEDIDVDDESRPFLSGSLRHFQKDDTSTEHTARTTVAGRSVYRYARAIRESQYRAIRDSRAATFSGGSFDPAVADPLRAILIIDRTSAFAEGQLLLMRIYIISAGLVALLLAALVFHYILTKLIFSPVRKLRHTTEHVQRGDLSARSQIKTGDEFEELSLAFNAMLDQLASNATQLRSINESLDLKLNELAQTNVGLYESNKFKSEFLANVSHELRTPLNSIIGFAELLDEIAKGEPEPNPKRLRYIQNILSSGRALLEMINELLDMAKIEAGRMEVNISSTAVGDLVEGLANIMRPQAERKGQTLKTMLGAELPSVETDPGRLQQILYNFVSNAIKFTPEGGAITITADRIKRQDNTTGVRIGVTDTGPGIPADMQELIFEKFRQIDASHTRAHAGTGLGLAICRELAQMLHATVSFISQPGRGATFYVDLPVTFHQDAAQPLMSV